MSDEQTHGDLAERFNAGARDYQEWLGSLGAHREEFERHYDAYKPADDDTDRMTRAMDLVGGTLRALIVADPSTHENWRGVAVMAKIADTFGLDLSIVPAEGNEDIVEGHTNLFGDSGTPTIVFLDTDGAELGYLSQPPNQVERDIIRAIEEQHGYDFPLEGPEYDAAVAEYLQGDGRKRESAWRHAQLWETIAAVAPDVQRAGSGTTGPVGVLRLEAAPARRG